MITRLSLVNMTSTRATTEMTLTHKSSSRSSILSEKQEKALLKQREDTEKPGETVDKFGNTSVTKINAETHNKVVLSKETIKQLMEYGRKDEWTLVTDSFDEIIVRLLRQVQKKRKRD